MTARLYEPFAQDVAGLIANINETEVPDMNIVLVSSAYTFSAAHTVRGNLTGVIATGPSVAGLTVTNGLVSITSPYTIPSVPTGTDIAAWVLVENGGTDRLVYFNNESGGLPLTPDGNNVDLTAASGLFRFRGTV